MTRLNRIILLSALAFLFPISACSGGSETASEAAHGEGAAEPEKGPHRGRILRDGDFALEMTIFEVGAPPQFRVYPTVDGDPVDPKSVDLKVTLRRLGGDVDVFKFKPGKDWLDGQGTVVEPHSFDVEVVASERGKRHVWKYENYEGRTRIPVDVAKDNGVTIETAGPAVIGETRELFGTVQLSTTGRSEIRGQFPGRIVSVTKVVGDRVRRGELLARIESSESLQVYPVHSTVSGVVAERNGNPGDVTFDRALYVITDPAQTQVVFNVFPKDLTLVRPGLRVEVETMDGQSIAGTTLGDYLAEGNAAAGTALMRANLPNRGERFRPGMALRGKVTVSSVEVPLAVRTEALQPFRDFTVVYANFGDAYEVRMLELGRRSPEWTEILSGLKPGTRYASKGAFLIRADVEKSGASHDH